MFPVVEAFQLAPHSAVRIFDELGSSWAWLIDGVGVYPLFDFYAAGAVVDFVGDICGL